MVTKSKPKRRKKTGLQSCPKHNSAKGRLKELVFDAEARREHLRGFSDRKRQRRAYGLAMQKIKDRNGKLEARRDRSKALAEQVENAEQQKEQLLDEILEQQNDGDDVSVGSKETSISKRAAFSQPTVTEYSDGLTQDQDQWGGHVIVTTSTKIPDDDNGDHGEPTEKRRKTQSVDSAQEYAGKVEKYLDELKGNMPTKKKKNLVNKSSRHVSGLKLITSTPSTRYHKDGKQPKIKDRKTSRRRK